MTSFPQTNGDLMASFREKAAFMKMWKPASTPSNRDRLELYAWHKQAVSGDAPSSITTPMTAAEKAKYTAWKTKGGTDSTEAMRNYITESERQVRVYGYTPTAAALEDDQGSAPRAAIGGSPCREPTSRGLAAIPLLCAAASEQRVTYLRRVQNTPMASAWWKRQEPLTAAPGSVYALPESLLLWVASTVEHLSLVINHNDQVLPGKFNLPEPVSAMLQSALWPLHNALLAVWMGLILIASLLTSTVDLTKTILLGSRRTGRTLSSIWSDDVVFAANSVHTLTEPHQPVSARVVGLVLQPLPLFVRLLGGMNTHNNRAALTQAGLFAFLSIVTWWYWLVTLPWFFVVVMLGLAVLLGNCFGLIELAAHI